MKKVLLLFAMTIMTSVMSFAQLEEGQISYDIEMSSDDEEMQMAVMMFSGSKMDLYFANDLARTDLEFGTMMSMTTVVNNASDEILILTGGMMGEKAVLTNSEEMEIDDEEDVEEPTIDLTKETQEIAGYTCKKAIITDSEGNEMEYWYTEEIKPVTTDKNAAASKLPGLALKYAIDREGLMMSFTAKKVETSLSGEVKNTKLSMDIPDGYEEMSYEEFSSMGM